MLFFIPWVLLIVTVIVAVPVVAKLSQSGARPVADDGEVNLDEYSEGDVEERPAMADDFAADPNEFGAEPLSDDAFADFN
jgi:hypothetical protein